LRVVDLEFDSRPSGVEIGNGVNFWRLSADKIFGGYRPARFVHNYEAPP
jgi:hypothetical protein